MKTKRILPNWPVWLAAALLACTLRLPAQSPPVITTQPASQTNLAGATASFTVAVSGTGPFTFQWQFNGTNLPDIITTVGGNGIPFYSGDGGAATNAEISPKGLALDASGNLYVADESNYRIREISTNGLITTVAGNGGSGHTGDGGSAVNAELDDPYGVAVDANDNLFIADTYNQCIREVTTNGLINTVAGTNNTGFGGDGGPATNAVLDLPWHVALDSYGNYYIADKSNNRIRKVTTNGLINTVAGTNSSGFSGDAAAAVTAKLNAPASVAVDASGDFLIADTGNNRIRKVTPNGVINTVAGNGTTGFTGDGGAATSAGLSSPGDVALDAAGNLFIADTAHNRVRRVDNLGNIMTVAGNGSTTYSGDQGVATNAGMYAYGVAVDANGNLYIADNGRIRKVTLHDEFGLELNNVSTNNAGNYSVVVSSASGSVTSSVASLTVVFPPGIAVQPQSALVTNGAPVAFNVAVSGNLPLNFQWQKNGTNLTDGGNVSGSATTNLSLSTTTTNDAGNYTLVITNAYGSLTSSPAALAVMFPLAGPMALNGGNAVFSAPVAGTGLFTYQWQLNGTNLPDIITTVGGNGSTSYSGDGGAATNAGISPVGLALDAAGNIYVADKGNSRIREIGTNGLITTVAGTNSSGFAGDGGPAVNARLYNPYGVALDANGNLYIADTSNQRIREVATNGLIHTVAGNGGNNSSGDGGLATSAGLNSPMHVAVDAGGNFYIADENNNCIRKVTTNGIINTVAGSNSVILHSPYFYGDGGPAIRAGLWAPTSVAVDAYSNLFIADMNNNRIRMVNTNGIISTVAGNGSQSFSGDNGAATNASLYWPEDVALDAAGNLFIADTSHYRIRRVDGFGNIRTVAGNGSSSYSGDQGVATNAGMYPYGVAVDASGNLYISDSGRIRKVMMHDDPGLVLNSVSSNSLGNYSVVVTSASGSVTSSVAALAVMFPPIITGQPQNTLVTNGVPVAFNVSVTGTPPMAFQWQKNGTNLTDGGNLSGSATNILNLSTTTTNDMGSYALIITNAYGCVTSSPALLTVVVPPGIVVQPAGQIVVNTSNVVFSVTAGGTGPFTYQWQLNGTNLPVNQIITTVAGNGTLAYSGDGGPATNAELSAYGMAVDPGGNLYISDYSNNRIRKVSTNGIISTVAGSGAGGFSGDGGAATNADLNSPYGVTVDSFENLYIADKGNNRIRKVGANGIITTVAGNGGTGFYGDGGAATNAYLYTPDGVAVDSGGNLYISDYNNSRIRKVNTNGIITTVVGAGPGEDSGDGGAATNATIGPPYGVAVDAVGDLFLADFYGHIRKVNTNGIISTLANVTALGLAVDAADTVYLASENYYIYKVNASGIMSIVAGRGNYGYSGDGGIATDALLNADGVAVDAAGNLYITTGNCRVREVDLAGLPALTLQNVTPASALLSYNSSSNSVFTALNGNGATNAGNFSVIVSSLYGSVTSSIVPLTVVFPPSITAQPASLAVTNGGTANFAVTAVGTAPLAFQWYGNNQALGNGASNLLTINPVNGNWAGNYYCVITNSYGSVTSRVATLTLALPPTVSVPPAGQTNLAGTAVTFNVKAGGTGPFAYQWQFNGTNLPNNLITTVAGNGTNGFAGDGGAATNASLWGPWFAAVDANGCVLISDNGNRRVRRVDTNGVITTVAGNGNTVYSGDGLPATNNGFYTISGVALDGYGIWYVGDAFFNRIHQVNGSGIMTTVVGGGPGYGVGYFAGDGGAATSAVLYDPNGVAVDAVGNLFLADTKNNRVRKVDPTGTITTVAGKGPSTGGPGGFSGDGGVATNASLNYPNSVAVDAAGDLFLADSNNQLIRKVDTNGIITTVAGNLTNSYAGDGGAATNASLSSPKDVKVDAWGNLYIADCGNNRIRRVDPNGIITTVAGNGTNAYAGDGSAATNASLANPTGVALDAAGNLIIVDYNNNRVREVFLAGTPTLALNNLNLTNAGNYSVVITNPYGSVTSSVVSLTVTIPTTPPQIISSGTSFGFLTNQFGFNLNGAFGQTIVVDGSTNLLDWTPLFTNTANGAPLYFFDPAWTNFPWRFYRARLP